MNKTNPTEDTLNLIIRLNSLLEKKGMPEQLVNYLSEIEKKASRKIKAENLTTDVTPKGYWWEVYEIVSQVKKRILEQKQEFTEIVAQFKDQMKEKPTISKQQKLNHLNITGEIVKGGKISIIGLNRAGKTTILQRLKTGRWIADTRPTIGMNSETIHIGKVRFTAWDLGGQLQFRKNLWNMYTKNSVGLVFVIDVSDPKRYPEARLALSQMLQLSHLQNLPLAVFANKVDLVEDLVEKDFPNILGISKGLQREVKVFRTSAKTGEGIIDGIYWLSDLILIDSQKIGTIASTPAS